MKKLGIHIFAHALAMTAGLTLSAAALAQTKIRIGTVQSMGAVVTYIAKDKGYFKDAGIDVELMLMNSSANVLALLAKDELQIVEGGISAGFFNALDTNLPIIIASDRVSTPIGHQLLVRADMKGKITKLADLKGRAVASNAKGSVTTYEIGKMFASTGMTLKDIDIKILGFPQMGAALKNGAVDAALVIPPFAAAYEQQGLGYSIGAVDDYAKPAPMTIAVSYLNSDWANKNKELVKKFYVAYLRATRDYCLAYHHGPNRKEIIDIAMKNGLERKVERLEKNPWTGRNMDGHVNMPSLLDMQKYYVQVGLTKKTFPAEKLVTTEYIDYANKALGPLPKVNPDSKLPGCR